MPRRAWIGIGGLAFAGALAVVLPPTTPVGPPAPASARRPSLLDRSPAAIPPPIYADQEAADAPGPYGGGPADPLPVTRVPIPAPPRETPAPVTRHIDAVGFEQDEDPHYDGPPDDSSRDADAAVADAADYRAGYRWAAEAGVDRQRDCRRWRGSAREEGCRAFVSAIRDDGRASAQPYDN